MRELSEEAKEHYRNTSPTAIVIMDIICFAISMLIIILVGLILGGQTY